MKMKIGADELILWLRKNEKASGIRNDDLGKRIADLIRDEFGGTLDDKDRDTPVHWDTRDGAFNVDEKNLPKTAAQYSIDTSVLPKLYETLNDW